MRRGLIVFALLVGCSGDESDARPAPADAAPDTARYSPRDADRLQAPPAERDDVGVAPVDASFGDDATSPTDSAVADTGGGTKPGCPNVMPADGQACLASSSIYAESYSCHYFASEYACAVPTKCQSAKFKSSGDDCSFEASACVAGAECGRLIERDSACIVACDRVCRCGTDGQLHCTAISCCPEGVSTCSPTKPCASGYYCLTGCCIIPD